jgi:hypothetical protein
LTQAAYEAIIACASAVDTRAVTMAVINARRYGTVGSTPTIIASAFNYIGPVKIVALFIQCTNAVHTLAIALCGA